MSAASRGPGRWRARPELGESSPAQHPAQALLAGRALRAGGITVDLAPVADVPGPGSFMAADDRTFGASGGGGRTGGDRVRARARGCEGRRDREALPGDRQGDEQHRLVARRDPREPRCPRERSGAVPRRDRSRRADGDDLERVVSGARLEAGSLVAADPVLAAQRARIQGRHDHRRARRGGRDAGANGAIRGGALRPGGGGHPALHRERGVERGGLRAPRRRRPPRDASRPRRCVAATTGSSRSSRRTAERAVVLEADARYAQITSSGG